MMRVASVCSGIGGAELAFDGIATHAFASEIDPFARAVLAHRFPHVPLYGDFTEITSHGPVDVLVGGTPCQSFSVAGLRGGMADARGNLALEFLRLADRLRARWVLWENVPGVLSSNGGRDFGSFVGGLAELGYGWAYRSLDAQYFGLAQRRRRVFVVGCLGDWRRACAVLFEPASLRGDSGPRRETREGIANALTERADRGGTNSEGQRLIAPPITGNPYGDHESREGLLVSSFNWQSDVAPTLPARRTAGGGLGTDFDCDGGLVATLGAENARHTSGLKSEADMLVAHSLRADGFDASEDGTRRGTPLVAFHQNQGAEVTISSTCGALKVGGGKPGQGYAAAQVGSAVRRLTPLECERLQGFPDGWTAITYRGKPAADGNRYRALGNAFAVPVVRWIARRLAREHAAAAQREAAA